MFARGESTIIVVEIFWTDNLCAMSPRIHLPISDDKFEYMNNSGRWFPFFSGYVWALLFRTNSLDLCLLDGHICAWVISFSVVVPFMFELHAGNLLLRDIYLPRAWTRNVRCHGFPKLFTWLVAVLEDRMHADCSCRLAGTRWDCAFSLSLCYNKSVFFNRLPRTHNVSNASYGRGSLSFVHV